MSGRKVVSRGTVLVDPRAAVAKLREFQLAEPGHYVLELVRAAVASGATAIELYNDSDDLVLWFDGAAPPPESLSRLLDHLFSNADRRLRLLAVAVNTALGLGPRFIDLDVTHDDPSAPGTVARVRWHAGLRETRFEDAPEDAPEGAVVTRVPPPERMPARGMRVHLREAFGLSVLREWFVGEPAETSLLRARCVAVPVPITLRGKPLGVRGWAPALVEVPLSLSGDLRGELSNTRPTSPDAAVFSEHGVVLDVEPLARRRGPRATSAPAAAPRRRAGAAHQRLALSREPRRGLRLDPRPRLGRRAARARRGRGSCPRRVRATHDA
ncbi:MAG: hypothetical protein R3A52_14340 [Polyangiales bacterium]